MKKTLSLFFAALSGAFVMAQDPGTVSFDKTSHDFGVIAEEKGPVTAEFTFTNTGKTPVYVREVIVSCGCTTPFYTKDTVAPGKTGVIKAQYDPNMRPGKFDKSLTVRLNTTPDFVNLRISGEVTERKKTLADQYPHKMGALRFKTNHFNLDSLYDDQEKTQSVEVLNDGVEEVTFISSNAPDSAVKFLYSKTTLQPGDTGTVTVWVSGKNMRDYDWIFKTYRIQTSDVTQRDKEVHVSMTIRQHFPEMSKKQLEKAPHIQFNTTNWDFGTIKKGDKVSTDFVFTNTGKKDLVILKVKAACSCTATQPDKTVLKPGESSTIKVTYSSFMKTGREAKTVTVVANDPTNPVTILHLSGQIAEQ